MSESNGHKNEYTKDDHKSTFRTKVGLAEMLKGGVIMDVVTPEQAVLAEEAGAAGGMAPGGAAGAIRKARGGWGDARSGGGVMDVVAPEQAVIAEGAGAAAVMALERVPSDIRKEGGVARMAPISKIREIMQSVSIPVMAKCRIGHFTEARILESRGGARVEG